MDWGEGRGHAWGFLEAEGSRQVLKSEARSQGEALGQKYESGQEKEAGSASAFINTLVRVGALSTGREGQDQSKLVG